MSTEDYILPSMKEIVQLLRCPVLTDRLLCHAFGLKRHIVLIYLIDILGINFTKSASEKIVLEDARLIAICEDCCSERCHLSHDTITEFAELIGNIVEVTDSRKVPIEENTLKVRLCCLRAVNRDVFDSFRSGSGAYLAEPTKGVSIFTNEQRSVRDSEFQYLSRIDGKTGDSSAVALLCRGRLSGGYYAMQVTMKSFLLKKYQRDPAALLFASRLLRMARHPCITSAHFAFQTPLMAVIVSPASECGTIAHILHASSTGRLSVARVRFYAAEISSALIYLHTRGVVVGDLSPTSVSLRLSGHITLSNLESVSGKSDYFHLMGCIVVNSFCNISLQS